MNFKKDVGVCLPVNQSNLWWLREFLREFIQFIPGVLAYDTYAVLGVLEVRKPLTNDVVLVHENPHLVLHGDLEDFSADGNFQKEQSE